MAYNMKLVFVLLLLLFFVVNIDAQNNFVQPGVPRELARWRALHYSDVRYKLNITLEKGAPLMKGEIAIRVTLDEEGAKNHLVLDWRVTQQAKDAKETPYAHVVGVNDAGEILTSESNEHIIIADGLLKKGENIIKIQFASPIATQGSAITRYIDREDNSEYIYSLFVPADASTAFPCFDQPDLKARFALEVISPSHWNIISNADMSSMTFPKDREKKSVFEETKPISTYVLAFAAGEFLAVKDEANKNLPTWIFVRRSQAKRMGKEAKEVFRLNRECIKFLEKYFDYKFPFPKYDFVLIPEFPFRGMEHAGATFLREESILFPTDPTANDYLTRAGLIFHETAHQWFGDLVTMKWFDDLWLKEGFAEFMAYKTIEATMLEFNAWKSFYERNKPLAYLTDSTKGTTPIYQEIPNLSSAKSAYGNIVYRKAPSFLRQAEFFLGADVFQKAIQSFVKKHAYKNAEWSDLVKAFEESSKKDLKAWADVWVKKRGMPSVAVKRGDKHIYFKPTPPHDVETIYWLEQQDVLGENSLWQMKLKVLMDFGDSRKDIEEVTLTREKANVKGFFTYIVRNPRNNQETPKMVFANYGDYGYGRFLLDEDSRDYAMQYIAEEKDVFLRSMLWGSLWDSVREAELAPKDYVSLVIKNIAVEKDEVTIQAILNRVSAAFTYYLSDAQSKELAPQMEKVLRERMLNAETLGQRITFYRAFLSIASTDAAREDLKKLLHGELKVNGMTLRARDKADIITKLIVLNDKDANALLDNFSKTETSDDAKRYAYSAAATIASVENKKKYFDDFTNNLNVAESWIESAFVTFNQTRQAELTRSFLESALKELPKLKRTRKIFFVNGWLAAFIGGQKSEEALKIVQKFLDEEKSLDNDLRLKVLEAVDGLERTVKIRNKFAN
jgi:aminopeptidase N